MNSNDKVIIKPVEATVQKILNDTARLHKKITYGTVGYSLYTDYFAIANYQLNSISSAIKLAQDDRYRDAFVILRTCIEHMMMFKLMTRANRYFLLFKKNKGETDVAAIARLNQQIADAKAKGDKTSALRAEPYIRAGVERVIYEGPYVNGEKKKGNLVPFYLSLYQQFSPEAAFLDMDDYFDYLPKRFRRRDIDRKNQTENKFRYTHYMSYAAMLESLKLNRLYTKVEISRLKAHYNFLSEFVHPTEGSTRILSLSNRKPSLISNLKEIREPHMSLRLLIDLYAGYIGASFSEDLIWVLKNAPKRYIKEFSSSDLERLISNFYINNDYFWFITNGPYSYDMFDYCVNHVNPDTLSGKYMNINPKKVTFKKEIYGRFMHLQGGWTNRAWGSYKPPFTLTGWKPY